MRNVRDRIGLLDLGIRRGMPRFVQALLRASPGLQLTERRGGDATAMEAVRESFLQQLAICAAADAEEAVEAHAPTPSQDELVATYTAITRYLREAGWTLWLLPHTASSASGRQLINLYKAGDVAVLELRR